MSLTYHQSRAIDITQKTGSSFSVLGEFLVIFTFLVDSRFRKPVNRLVFYATWGNIFCNLATLIGQSAIRIGLASPLCQFQAFLIQWLMPADALWIFVMACNVWLAFFYQWEAGKLRTLEWWYILFCYGCPLIPALVLLCIETEARGRIYGDATLWCWISIKWDFLRVAIFYGPVWVIILLTCAIYVRVGAAIWKWGQRLQVVEKRSNEDAQRSLADTNTPAHEIRRTDEVLVTRGVSNEEPQRRFQDTVPTFGPQSLHNRAYVVFSTGSRNQGGKGRLRNRRSNRATIRYCKCALLFFIALTVVWVPSTINRIWTLVYPTEIIFGLQFAAALVLPLQGFWNAIIYFATSSYACQCLWRDTLSRLGYGQSAPEGKSVPTHNRSQTNDPTTKSCRGGAGCVESDHDTVIGSEADADSLKSSQTLE